MPKCIGVYLLTIKCSFKVATHGFTWYDWIAFYIPIFGWIRTYKIKEYLLYDVLAGLSVGIMAIPQGMSYAQNLAYLPQVYGLYGIAIPTLLYGVLGSSRQLAVGPVAVTSLILGSGLSNIFGNFQINPSDPGDALQVALQDRYNRAAIQVAFIAGLFYTAVGLLRLGWIVNFLSYPVISGFMTGAASIILSGQVKYITGQKLPRADTLYTNLNLVFNNMDKFKWQEFIMGMSFIILLVAFKLISKRYKRVFWLNSIGPLTVCIISIALMNGFKWYVFNPEIPGTPIIKPVGSIPKGMPTVTASWWFPLYNVSQQLLLAVVVCLLDIVESTSIARALAQKNKYRLNFTQELRGLGLANLGGALFNCYTTTGSFSRSAVNNSVGAKTQLAGMITGLLMIFVLLWLTPVFQNMSANVQGAIVIVGCLSIFDFEGFFYSYRVNRFDCFCWVVAYIVTAFAGAEIGIATAVGTSVLIFLLRNAFPSIRELARIPGEDNAYDTTAVYPTADPILVKDGILALRVEANLFFANTPFMRDYIESRLDRARIDGFEPKVILLDVSTATDIDVGACVVIRDMYVELRRDGLDMVFANPTKSVIETLVRANLINTIGAENFQATVAEGLERAKRIVEDKRAKALVAAPETVVEKSV